MVAADCTDTVCPDYDGRDRMQPPERGGRKPTGQRPAELFAELNRCMLDVLHQEGRKPGAGDGMDVALCRIASAKRELLFAGASARCTGCTMGSSP